MWASISVILVGAKMLAMVSDLMVYQLTLETV